MSNGSTGWNRPRPSAECGAPSAKKVQGAWCVVLGAVAVMLGIGAWFLWPEGEHGEDAASTRRVGIKEATPVKARKPFEPKKRRTVVKTGDKLKDALAEVEASGELVQISTPMSKELAEAREKARIPFNSGVEQLMCWVFSRELGDVPMIVPSISEEERGRLAEILISKMEIKEDDSESTIALKQTIDYAKKEMAKFIGDGGDPDDFLNYYVQQQRVAFDTRMQAQQQYQELWDEDRTMAKEFAKKANELLADKGIKPIDEDEDDVDVQENESPNA